MDIDIDLPKLFDPQSIFPAIKASMIQNSELKPHLVGYYFQNISTDPITGLAAIPYTDAQYFGYTKIDMIHLSLLQQFTSKEQMLALQDKEPNWKLLEDRSFVEKLFHINKQFDVVYKVKPKSVIELADVLCLIRTHKIKLLDKYIRNKNAIRPELYTKREDDDMRKSHAVAYALTIVAQMNLLETDYTYEPFE